VKETEKNAGPQKGEEGGKKASEGPSPGREETGKRNKPMI